VRASTRQLYRIKARVFGALAHPIRLAIADSLRDGELCVCEIAKAVAAERSNVSRHLALMVGAGVLRSHKEGLMVYYSLRCPCILEFLSCVESVLREQLEENKALLSSL
jgi:DNA-binding transcriptional ArsR family regulator